MIDFFRDLFKGINSSDGLESIMSLLVLCVMIPVSMLVIGILYKIIIYII